MLPKYCACYLGFLYLMNLSYQGSNSHTSFTLGKGWSALPVMLVSKITTWHRSIPAFEIHLNGCSNLQQVRFERRDAVLICNETRSNPEGKDKRGWMGLLLEWAFPAMFSFSFHFCCTPSIFPPSFLSVHCLFLLEMLYIMIPSAWVFLSRNELFLLFHLLTTLRNFKWRWC